MAAKREGFAASGHRFSELSEKALGAFCSTDQELCQIEDRIAEIANLIDGSDSDLGQLRSELAQLETSAKQIEVKGVDDVYTSELTSGKQIAKSSKKHMLQRLEALFSRTDELFASIKSKQK
mmetsp:Transcript_108541/g.317575  ORF Transcript_108541/g.317575 Transcript_108541/m.317575 type:complete len:122 (-) Transcript_108541:93-458(-)